MEIDAIHIMIITLIATIASVVIALIEIRRSKKATEYTVFYNLMNLIRTDKKMNDALYKIEYSEDWYPNYFHGSDLEKKVDLMLSFLDFSCYLRKKKVLKRGDFYFFKFQIESVVSKKPMGDYIHNLIIWANHDRVTFQFDNLREYCVKEKLFKEGMGNPDLDDYEVSEFTVTALKINK